MNAKAYSTKNKTLHSELKWVESTIRLREVPKQEVETIQTHLIKTGANKMVLKLLSKQVFRKYPEYEAQLTGWKG